MKKQLKVLAVVAIMALPMGLTAADTSSSPSEAELLAKCTIDVPGFYAKGNCNKVLEAYREFKSISKQ